MKLNVLFLVGRDPQHSGAGGGDIQAWAWAKWCVDQGHHVTYICQSDEHLPKRENVDGIEVLRLASGPRLALSAYRYVRKHRPDIDLIYEDPIGGGRTPYLSPLYAKRPVVAVWHQVSADLFASLHPKPIAITFSLIEKMVATVYRKCWFWVPSQESKDAVQKQLRFAPSRVAVVSPTVPASLVHEARLIAPEPKILFLGVFRRYKAVDHVVRSLPAVLERVPNATLLIAGRRMDDEYELEVCALAAELGVAHAIKFEFNVSEVRKQELMSEARVLVLPSLLEGFGIVSIEANGLGTPVVASSGVPAEAVKDGINGLRYHYGNFAELSDALTEVLSDDQLFVQLSKGSIEAAHDRLPAVQGVHFAELINAAMQNRGLNTDGDAQ